MKVLVNFCVFIATVTATHWIERREESNASDCGENNICSMVYNPIVPVMQGPNFALLVDDVTHQMNLDCSASTFSDLTDCGYALPVCHGGIPGPVLRIAWEYFCQNKAVVEGLNDCLNTVNMLFYMRKCVMLQEEPQPEPLSECVGQEVAAISSCGQSGGAFFLGFLNWMHEAGLL